MIEALFFWVTLWTRWGVRASDEKGGEEETIGRRLYEGMVGLVQINGYHFGSVIREKLSFHWCRPISIYKDSWGPGRIFNGITILGTFSPSFSRNEDATDIPLFRFSPTIPPNRLVRFPWIRDSNSRMKCGRPKNIYRDMRNCNVISI